MFSAKWTPYDTGQYKKQTRNDEPCFDTERSEIRNNTI